MPIRTILTILLFIMSLLPLPAIATAAGHTITVGVLSHRPKTETSSRFQPLVMHLEKELPEQHIRLEVLSYPELEAALTANRLDFVLTNPGHYIQLRHLSSLSGALATMIEQENGQSISSFGGVIFTRSDRSDINSLVHLKGKQIATVGTSSLGGYQSQAFELMKIGVYLPHDAGLLVTGMPHDSTIQAVSEGRADAGMVRTGVLEEMAKEGKLDLSSLKILNRQEFPGFPYISSTPLYPQWPFIALPHVTKELAQRVATALMEMPRIHQANGLEGFTIPANYSPVEDLLRELRLPPFDKVPAFTMHDIWQRYQWHIFTVLLAGTIILLLVMRLIIANRKLSDSELRYRTVANFTYDWEYWVAPDGKYLYMSPSCEQVCGYSAEDFYRDPMLLTKIIHPEDQHLFTNHTHKISEKLEPEPIDFRIITRNGQERWIAHVCRTVVSEDGNSLGQRASNRDITERIKVEQERRYFFNIIERSLNEIYVFDSETLKFKYVNHGALKNLQYTLDEMMTMTPIAIKPEVKEESFQELIKPLLDNMQDVLVFQTVHKRADGTTYPVEVHLQLLDIGSQRVFLAIIFDITERKRAEREREEALSRVRKLEGIIPICMYCKKIRDDQNSWNQLEQYITNHSEAMFSHGICPQCYEEHRADLKKYKTSI